MPGPEQVADLDSALKRILERTGKDVVAATPARARQAEPPAQRACTGA
jgi:hypothetical protein